MDEAQKQELRRKLADKGYEDEALSSIAEDLMFGRKSLMPAPTMMDAPLEPRLLKSDPKDIARAKAWYHKNKDRALESARKRRPPKFPRIGLTPERRVERKRAAKKRYREKHREQIKIENRNRYQANKNKT